MRHLKFTQAIWEATDQLMERYPEVYLMGLGVPDPKGIFGTTLGLQDKYGASRVMDMPTSENAMTGIAIGSAIVGMRPIMTHQRVDFFLLALDQLINNAAKWSFMFGDQMKVPLVIRLIIGRGWGQGPQHSQTLHSLFAHIPGLKVVMPSNPYDAKGLLISSVLNEGPVVYLEHRWLHNTYGHVPLELYSIPFGKAKVVREGDDITIISCSQMTIDALRASQMLEERGISTEVIDLRSIKPLDENTIMESVKKTGRVLIADPDWKMCGFGSEIAAMLSEHCFYYLKGPVKRLTYPDELVPTSWMASNFYYPTAYDIAASACKMLSRKDEEKQLLEMMIEEKMTKFLDVPDATFTGPF